MTGTREIVAGVHGELPIDGKTVSFLRRRAGAGEL
jgi:hypothetical protein